MSDLNDAEDIVANTYFKLFQLSSDKSISLKLAFVVVRHRSIDLLRRNKRNYWARTNCEMSELNKVEAKASAHENHELKFSVEQFISQLEPDAKRLLEWRFKQNLTYQEVADRLSVSRQTATNRIIRIIKRGQIALRDQDPKNN